MPIVAIWALAVLAMGVLLVMQPQSRARPEPSHYLTSGIAGVAQRLERERACQKMNTANGG